eukprot:SAG31_NODE_1515_length_8037_cov_2.470773_4_plen_159_part_00
MATAGLNYDSCQRHNGTALTGLHHNFLIGKARRKFNHISGNSETQFPRARSRNVKGVACVSDATENQVYIISPAERSFALITLSLSIRLCSIVSCGIYINICTPCTALSSQRDANIKGDTQLWEEVSMITGMRPRLAEDADLWTIHRWLSERAKLYTW